MRSGDGFLEQLAKHLEGLADPTTAIVEGIAFAVEHLADDDRIVSMLTTRQLGGMAMSITSDTAMAFGRSMFHRSEVDWQANGFDEAALDELAEFSLRVLHSFLIEPGDAPRSPGALREFLTRWLGPAIIYPRLAGVMSALTPPPQRRNRRSSAS